MPEAFVDSVLDHFDQGTQRAILRLYRSSPPEVLAAPGERLAELTVPALVLWGDARPLHPGALRRGVRRRAGPGRRAARARRRRATGRGWIAPTWSTASSEFSARRVSARAHAATPMPRGARRAHPARCPRRLPAWALTAALAVALPGRGARQRRTSRRRSTARDLFEHGRAHRCGTASGSAATTCSAYSRALPAAGRGCRAARWSARSPRCASAVAVRAASRAATGARTPGSARCWFAASTATNLLHRAPDVRARRGDGPRRPARAAAGPREALALGLAALCSLASPVAGSSWRSRVSPGGSADRRRRWPRRSPWPRWLPRRRRCPLAFPERGTRPFVAITLWPILRLLGGCSSRSCPRERAGAARGRRPVRRSPRSPPFVVDTPMGGNIARLGTHFGPAVLACVLWPHRRWLLLALRAAPALLAVEADRQRPGQGARTPRRRRPSTSRSLSFLADSPRPARRASRSSPTRVALGGAPRGRTLPARARLGAPARHALGRPLLRRRR